MVIHIDENAEKDMLSVDMLIEKTLDCFCDMLVLECNSRVYAILTDCDKSEFNGIYWLNTETRHLVLVDRINTVNGEIRCLK